MALIEFVSQGLYILDELPGLWEEIGLPTCKLLVLLLLLLLLLTAAALASLAAAAAATAAARACK